MSAKEENQDIPSNSVSVHFRVPRTILVLVDAVADSRGLTRSSFIREAILLELLPFLPIEQQEHIRGKYQ